MYKNTFKIYETYSNSNKLRKYDPFIKSKRNNKVVSAEK